jgi:hypothetical protein
MAIQIHLIEWPSYFDYESESNRGYFHTHGFLQLNYVLYITLFSTILLELGSMYQNSEMQIYGEVRSMKKSFRFVAQDIFIFISGCLVLM